MMRVAALCGVAAAVLLTSGCDSSDTAEAQPSPSYSGPAWDAYRAGREFGAKHQDDARVPGDVARSAESDSLGDAISADMDNAEWWCTRNLPGELETAHQDQEEALVAGCVGGVLPLADHPELYVQ
ncbi:hypothetical protein [Streptomyces cellulosae]|uniref:Secreted protein n=1 Tax=Streptomyces cellulosae TaxID=1968 RepID=A0ABW7YHE0_STRCE